MRFKQYANSMPEVPPDPDRGVAGAVRWEADLSHSCPARLRPLQDELLSIDFTESFGRFVC